MTTSAARTALSSTTLSANAAESRQSSASAPVGAAVAALLHNALGSSVHSAQLNSLNEVITKIAFEG
ncbi:unnamed protein product [Toxocara canis]|nr:unnamed protein product [Toxocara canis]